MSGVMRIVANFCDCRFSSVLSSNSASWRWLGLQPSTTSRSVLSIRVQVEDVTRAARSNSALARSSVATVGARLGSPTSVTKALSAKSRHGITKYETGGLCSVRRCWMNPAIRRALRLLALKMSQPSPCRSRCSTVSKYRLIRCRRSRSWIGACSMRDSRSVILDSPFARRLERTVTGRLYRILLDTTLCCVLKMPTGLTTFVFDETVPGGRETHSPAELLEGPFGVDRRGDPRRSRPRDTRSTSFRFNAIDCDCHLLEINQCWVGRDRDRKRIVERKSVAT